MRALPLLVPYAVSGLLITNYFKYSSSTPLNIASTVLEALTCCLTAPAAYSMARATSTTVIPITKAVEVVARTEVSFRESAARATYCGALTVA